MGRRILWVLCTAVSLTAPSRFGSTDERQPSGTLWAEDALAPENATEARLNGIQPPDQVLRAIGLQAGMVVGEIGAGRGRYTVQIAVRVGEAGKVYANDIDAAALDHLRQRCARWGIANVETVPGRETDPRLPKGELDLLFMVSTYHHISQPIELMRNARPALKPEGRLAIVEWAPLEGEESRGSQTPPQVLERQMSQAGFALERTIPFQRPSDSFNVYVFRVSAGAIAFYSTRSGRDDVYVMDADGRNVQLVTKSKHGGKCPDLSPDGAQIVFVSLHGGNSDLSVLDLDTGAENRLTHLPSVERQPKWSPDGARIAFQSNRDGNYEIYTMDADGSNWRRLTFSEAEELWPNWSPDGTQIAFQTMKDGNFEIYVTDADGSHLRNLTNHPATTTGLRGWHRDNRPWSLRRRARRPGRRDSPAGC